MNRGPVNRTEKIVSDICGRNFFSFWSYSNPIGQQGKELCDSLVVFRDKIIIFSVKEISVSTNCDPAAARDRWKRKAVDKSASQIIGAERWILANQDLLVDRWYGSVTLPENARILRVAIAFGSPDDLSVPPAHFVSGKCVHVLTEQSMRIILGELDTVADFINYLEEKEAFLARGGTVLLESEEDLLGVYLANERQIPFGQLAIEPGFWSKVIAMPEFIARKEEDKISYLWDEVIEYVSRSYIRARTGGSADHHTFDFALGTMASESRFSRRILGAHLWANWEKGRLKPDAGRCALLPSPFISGVIYAVCLFPPSHDREARGLEVQARAIVGGFQFPATDTVIGIGSETDFLVTGRYTIDLAVHSVSSLSDDDRGFWKNFQAEHGWYSDKRSHDVDIQEFPREST